MITGTNIVVVAVFLFLIAGALALGGWIGRRQERAARRNDWQARIARGLVGARPALPNCASAAAGDPADARPAAVSVPPTPPAAGHSNAADPTA